ncbi:MAG: hypothetical protein ACRC11_11065 [Xenococcaceae cyanobacterium]
MQASEIQEILALNPRHQQTIDRLIDLYKFITQLWTKTAVKDFATSKGLNLRKKSDRALFARLAGAEEVKALPPSQNPKHQLKAATQTLKIVALVAGYLPPAKELNGLQNSPAFRILGKPYSKAELHRNYHRLIKQEHPDVSQYPIQIATERFKIVVGIYRQLNANWENKYNPTLPINPDDLAASLNVKYPDFAHPDSFWTDV